MDNSRNKIVHLNNAAQDLREKMKLAKDVLKFNVETIPDDLKIKLKVYMKDGSIKERIFCRKTKDKTM